MALLYDPEAAAGSRISTLASSGIHRCVCALIQGGGMVAWGGKSAEILVSGRCRAHAYGAGHSHRLGAGAADGHTCHA
jgi:hypothetical protein